MKIEIHDLRAPAPLIRKINARNRRRAIVRGAFAGGQSVLMVIAVLCVVALYVATLLGY